MGQTAAQWHWRKERTGEITAHVFPCLWAQEMRFRRWITSASRMLRKTSFQLELVTDLRRSSHDKLPWHTMTCYGEAYGKGECPRWRHQSIRFDLPGCGGSCLVCKAQRHASVTHSPSVIVERVLELCFAFGKHGMPEARLGPVKFHW